MPPQDHHFQESDVRHFLVEVCAELPASTVQHRWKHVNVLLRLSMLAGLQAQLDSTLSLLCSYAKEIVDFDSASVFFWNEIEEKFQLREANSSGQSLTRVECDENILNRWCVQHVCPVLAEIGGHPAIDALLTKMNAASSLSVPIFVNNRPMGSFQFFSKRSGSFTIEDAQLLWTLTRVAENLLAREQANEGLIHFAFTDHLTGLRTRGYLEQQLDVELKRSERKEEQFVILMLDIDHFKCLNDTFGHNIGDTVLRQVARILEKDMREVDTVARYGGEEFVIIMPDTTEDEALAVAQRIRRSVEHADLAASISEPGKTMPKQKLSISIGLAVFDPKVLPASRLKTKQELLQEADAALYFAKSHGRNQVIRFNHMQQIQTKAS